MPVGQRGEFPGTYRQGNKWGVKIWIDGELHYLGLFDCREKATEYAQLVESRYPNRLRRNRGTVTRSRKKWVALRPRPGRELVGWFDTRWAAELALKRLGVR